MPAQKLNLKGENKIEQGSTFEMEITVRNSDGSLYDLTTASVAAQIRETTAATTSVAFTTAINTTTSVITLSLSATVTAAISFESGVWDCEITEGSTVTRILEGKVDISPEVTKA
jgi:hypothetical protein